MTTFTKTCNTLLRQLKKWLMATTKEWLYAELYDAVCLGSGVAGVASSTKFCIFGFTSKYKYNQDLAGMASGYRKYANRYGRTRPRYQCWILDATNISEGGMVGPGGMPASCRYTTARRTYDELTNDGYASKQNARLWCG